MKQWLIMSCTCILWSCGTMDYDETQDDQENQEKNEEDELGEGPNVIAVDPKPGPRTEEKRRLEPKKEVRNFEMEDLENLELSAEALWVFQMLNEQQTRRFATDLERQENNTSRRLMGMGFVLGAGGFPLMHYGAHRSIESRKTRARDRRSWPLWPTGVKVAGLGGACGFALGALAAQLSSNPAMNVAAPPPTQPAIYTRSQARQDTLEVLNNGGEDDRERDE